MHSQNEKAVEARARRAARNLGLVIRKSRRGYSCDKLRWLRHHQSALQQRRSGPEVRHEWAKPKEHRSYNYAATVRRHAY